MQRYNRKGFVSFQLMMPFRTNGKPDGADFGDAESRFRRERDRMVETQIRMRGVTDARVLDAMRSIPRHRFVPAGSVNGAYDDRAMSIGFDQTISQPYIVAYMTEALKLTGGERVLEIGTGSGYQAAVLAKLAAKVYTIERLGRLSRRARENLAALGVKNVEHRIGDGTQGWREESPFDAIIVTAAPPRIPEPLREQLAVGGRLVAPVGERFHQTLVRITRESESDYKTETLLSVSFVPLIGEHGWNGGGVVDE
jgi:protein-L-isoaspartate(D-aspartate) O-methyltransferase